MAKKQAKKIIVQPNNNIKKILKEQKLSQQWLADTIEKPKYHVSRICTGQQQDIYLSTAKNIAKALGKTLDDVFGDYKEESKTKK